MSKKIQVKLNEEQEAVIRRTATGIALEAFYAHRERLLETAAEDQGIRFQLSVLNWMINEKQKEIDAW